MPAVYVVHAGVFNMLPQTWWLLTTWTPPLLSQAHSSQWLHWAVVGVVRLGCGWGTHWTAFEADTLGYVWGTHWAVVGVYTGVRLGWPHWTAVGVLTGLSSFCMFMSCSHFLISWLVGLSVVCLLSVWYSCHQHCQCLLPLLLSLFSSSPFLMRSHSVAQVDLEFEIFLPWLHEFWDFQHQPL